MVDCRQAVSLSPTKGYQDKQINWGMRLSKKKKGVVAKKVGIFFKRGGL